MPSRVRPSAMANSPLPVTYSSKIRTKTGAVTGSGSRRWIRMPRAAFPGLGVGTRVRQPIPVGRAADEEAALGGGLRGHGAANPGSDPGALALAHAAEERHDHVVGLGAGIDPPADLWDPQLDAVVLEQWEGQGELRAVEGTLRLPDGNGFEASVVPDGPPRLTLRAASILLEILMNAAERDGGRDDSPPA
jgi:hypothetical protein